MNSARSAHLDLRPFKPTHTFREPSDIRAITGNDTLLMELVATAAFQRLKEIRFLGAIDYRLVPSPNGKPGATRYTRYEHSLGVLQLAQLILRNPGHAFGKAATSMRRGASTRHRAPTTFTFDGSPLSRKFWELNITKRRKTSFLGMCLWGKDVHTVLRSHGIDIENVIALISGEYTGIDGFFSGPINFDTIEGILRSREYVDRRSTIPKPDIVTEAAIRRETPKDQDIVDDFWRYKDWVYKKIINSRTGVLSDLACQLLLLSNVDNIDIDCYFSTEASLFKRLPSLKALLASHTLELDVLRLIDEPIHYRDRNYYIDPAGDFFARRDDARYKHSRSVKVLPLTDEDTPLAAGPVHSPQEALFDDYPL